MSTDELRLWIYNDEGLYLAWQAWQRHNKGKDIRHYIKEHREQLTKAINKALK